MISLYPIKQAKPLQNCISAAIFTLLLLASCQPSTENKATITSQVSSAATPADTVQKRPAPTFYIIPPDLIRKRVWLCDAPAADVFHTRNDCPVLLECRGKGTFRNVTLQRAIEEYGRYNCPVCSKELSSIFDENLVR
ncbi:hypothetical protein [Pontibacter chitinilyticus]|uniref:hypothetical protein n=1 Tax=Pontibacter chitinilyticus TaxID=2674989 RepID=UPI0032198FED